MLPDARPFLSETSVLAHLVVAMTDVPHHCLSLLVGAHLAMVWPAL